MCSAGYCADDEVSSLAPLAHNNSCEFKAAVVTLGPKAVKGVRMLQCSPSEWADTHKMTLPQTINLHSWQCWGLLHVPGEGPQWRSGPSG